MQKTKKRIRDKSSLVTRLEGMLLSEKRPDVKAQLEEKIQKLKAEQQEFDAWVKRARQLRWYQVHRPDSDNIAKLTEAIDAWKSKSQDNREHLESAMAGYCHDGTDPAELPIAETMYVCATAVMAVQLDAIGYPATCAQELDVLQNFSGQDIILTHPNVFHLADSLQNIPDHRHEFPAHLLKESGSPLHRFIVHKIDGWIGGKPHLLELVPMETHLLTLAERKDVNTYPGCPNLEKSQAIYQAFFDDDWDTYKQLAKEFIAA